ncbi:MAG: hypothetical protein GW949_00130 [Spirochaetales bacterium]|nr:hypothetical protein [Spirochaetales bacterium]
MVVDCTGGLAARPANLPWRFLLQRSPGGVIFLAVLLVTSAGALAPLPLAAETALSVRLTASAGAIYDENPPAGVATSKGWNFAPGGLAELVVTSRGNSQVRGEVRLGVIPIGPTATVDLSRAWFKFRVPEPGLVVTAGKTRLGWGEGLVFNVADLVHGSTGTGINLVAEELRADATWLIAATLSLGQFAFLETVVKIDIPPSVIYPTVAPPTIDDLGAGARIRLPLGPVSAEAAYLWGNLKHSTSLTAQFALGINWFVSGRLDIPSPWATNQNVTGSVSAGLYDIFPLGQSDTSLSVRFESLVVPDQDPLLYSFGDLTLGWGGAHSLGLRSLVSPLGPSANWSVSYSWAGLQGLSLIFGVGGYAGASDTTFGWGRAPSVVGTPSPDFAFTTTARFVY